MAYTEWGDPGNKKVLVCVHGLTRVGADFDELAETMSDHYRVVCPDVAGRGYSDWLTNPAFYQTPIYVSDMVTLLARVNADTVHWFGTSMGGIIGMGLACLPNNPIKRMVLNDVGALISAAALERIGSYVGHDMHFDSFEAAKQHIMSVAASFGEHTDAQWTKLTEDVIRPDQKNGGVRLHYDPALGDVFRHSNGAKVSDIVLWDFYDKITCPVLSVRGISSDLLTVETHKEMALRGPRAELVTIAKAGHAPTFVTPEQIAIARRFLLADGAA
jgi:pimeloyl-ACP methyl ester carboxylesterase